MAGASGGAIKAGQAWVGLGVVDTGLVKGLEAAKRRVEAFGKWTASVGMKTAAAGGAVLAPIAAVFKSSLNRASDIKDLSDQLGIGAEAVSSFAYAFERGGVDLEGFGDVFKSLQQKMFAAADGTDETFRRLGLNARNLEKLPIDKQFEIILDRVNSLVDPIDRATVGAEMFGSSWSKLQNTTLKSADALKQLREEAAQVGAVITDEQAAKGKQLTQSITEGWQALKYAVLEVGMALLGYTDNVGDVVGAIKAAAAQAREWIQENRGLIVTVAALAAGVVAAGVALLAFSSICTALATVIGVVSGAVTILSGALGLLFSTGGLIVIGVVAVAALAGAFDNMGSVFGETWGGIMAAIGSGDIKAALNIVVAGVEAVWATFVTNLTEIWVKFKNVVVDTWHDITDALSAGIVVLKTGIRYFTEGEEAAASKGNAELDQIVAMRKAKDDENRRFRQQQIDNARAREADARAELSALVNRAKAGAAAKRGEGGGESGSSVDQKTGALLRNRQDPMVLYGAAKGTFGSYSGAGIGKSLGYGDNIAQRQLTTQQQILAANKQQVAAIAGIAAVAWK